MIPDPVNRPWRASEPVFGSVPDLEHAKLAAVGEFDSWQRGDTMRNDRRGTNQNGAQANRDAPYFHAPTIGA